LWDSRPTLLLQAQPLNATAEHAVMFAKEHGLAAATDSIVVNGFQP
jgi:hypothetical protein